MSSKLYRGGEVALDPVSWPRAGQADSGHRTLVVPAYIPPGALPGALPGAVEQNDPGAHQRAIEEGKNAARREAAEKMEALNLQVARTIEELSGLRPRFRHEAEEDVVALAIAIARRILHRELTVAPEALLGLVKAALEKIELGEVYRVRVARADAALIKQHFEKMGLPRPIEVVGDPGLQRGSAIFESSRGALDASVETQLAEIERGFADLVRRA